MSKPSVKVGDILASDAQTLVNTVNTVGIMGKGIALHFKKQFPEMYEDYVRRCKAHEVRLGRPYLYKHLVGHWILNFPTKDHWRSVSRLSDIVEGLRYLREHYREWGITSIAVPPLGCGHGQLEWRVVGPTLYRHLAQLDIPVELYAPHDAPDEQLSTAFLGQDIEAVSVNGHHLPESKIKPSWVALVEIIARLDRARYRNPVGRTIFQKIAYFATAAGIPTDLVHVRGSYGPFSAQVRPLVARLENNGLLREERHGRMFLVKPGPTYRDAAEAYRANLEQWEPMIERVVDLFLRVRTDEAEVAATVLFTATSMSQGRDEPVSELEVFHAVKDWKQRRTPPLADVDIAEAIRHLNMLKWFKVRFSSELPLPNDELAAV